MPLCEVFYVLHININAMCTLVNVYNICLKYIAHTRIEIFGFILKTYIHIYCFTFIYSLLVCLIKLLSINISSLRNTVKFNLFYSPTLVLYIFTKKETFKWFTRKNIHKYKKMFKYFKNYSWVRITIQLYQLILYINIIYQLSRIVDLDKIIIA